MDALLVANRAEIARRIFRTARLLGIRTIAVFVDEDRRSPHVREADEAVRIESYLDVSSIMQAAAVAAADAVHPGYGFLAERPELAKAVIAAGLTWVGPPPDVISALGDKVRAKELMRRAGVPVVDTVVVGEPGWEAAAAALPLPILVKATAGGGGRGMRVVTDRKHLVSTTELAAREAASAFGDGTVFLERHLQDPHHVEVQIIADRHGHVVHLGERECSIQRRYQKILEESPSPNVSSTLRERLTRAAIDGARAVGYVGLGTWEFLLHGAEVTFLEVNTRIQVEHPVTEAVTGLDLVDLQLRVADGQPLPLTQDEIRFEGHAMEARLVAEAPENCWLPSTGRINAARWPSGQGIRVDAGYEEGDQVGGSYDSLLAKVIAHGRDRDESRRRLAGAMDRLVLAGPTTNRCMLAATLREPGFIAGETTTGYLDRHPEVSVIPPPDPDRLVVAVLWQRLADQADVPVLRSIPGGFRNVRSQLTNAIWRFATNESSVQHQVDGDRYTVVIDGEEHCGQLIECCGTTVAIERDGRIQRYTVLPVEGSLLVLGSGGQELLSRLPRFKLDLGGDVDHGGSRAPLPGLVLRVEVQVGEMVTAGQDLVILEAMKLEHRLRAAASGRVTEVLVAAGDKVEKDQLLVLVE